MLEKITVFWTCFDATSIVSDIFLIAWPVLMFRKLHTSLKNRLLVQICFGARFLLVSSLRFKAHVADASRVILASIAHIVMIVRADNNPLGWPLVICSQLVQCLTLTTACVPYLRAFLSSIPCGAFQPGNLERLGYDSTAASSKRSDSDASLAVAVIGGRKGSSSTVKTAATCEARGIKMMLKV